MGENQGMEQILGKLVELLTAKKDEVASSSREIVTHSEPVQKIELMANDIKLEGVKNYLSWSRRALLILRTKGLESFVEKETEPVDKSGAEWRAWNATNSLVLAWLLNSLSPPIAATIESISSAAEAWKTLSRLYSGKGNVMLIVETQERISDVKQGERPVMEYVAELQRLWTDLDHYDPIGLTDPESITKVEKWIERRRVIEFMKGLNSEFDGRRAAMCHQPSLLTLDEAIAAMAQEETRLKVLSSPKDLRQPSRPAFIAVETRECYNCGKIGHLSRDCRAPRQGNRGRGRGSYRGNYRGAPSGPGRGRGYGNDHKANVVVADSQEGTQAVENVANLAHPGTSSKWILDSGASRHVTGKTDREETWDWNQA